MTSRARREAAYRHGLRVRMGPAGPKGVLLHCESRNGGGHYWRIRLTSGEWVWPDDTLAIDGPGGVLAAEPCQSCELPFITVAGSPELICDRCSAEQFGTAARTDPPPAKRWNARRRWRP